MSNGFPRHRQLSLLGRVSESTNSGVPSPFVSGFKIVGKSGKCRRHESFIRGGGGGPPLEFFLIWQAQNAISQHLELKHPTFLGGGGGAEMMWTQLRICVHVGTRLTKTLCNMINN